MKDTAFFYEPLVPPNYMSIIDDDVAALFKGNKSYLSFEPLLAQLVKELRLQRQSREGLKCETM